MNSANCEDATTISVILKDISPAKGNNLVMNKRVTEESVAASPETKFISYRCPPKKVKLTRSN